MKLTALGIDSMEFDAERAKDFKKNLMVVYNWIDMGEEAQAGKKSVCEAASILDKLVTRSVPLTQYRGLKFEDPAVADALIGGKTVSKMECESWTLRKDIAEEFAQDVGPKPFIRFVMIRTFSKNEIILDLDGLTDVFKSLIEELKEADKRGELHPSLGEDRVFTQKAMEGFISTVEDFSESEFLVHPRPYSAWDLLKVSIDEGFGRKVDRWSFDNLHKVLIGNRSRTFKDLLGKQVIFKNGRAVKIK